MSMRLLFVINVFLAFLWAILLQSTGVVDLLIGFAIGLIILSVVEPQYSNRGIRIPLLMLYVTWEIIVGGFVVSAYILRPQPNLRQGIVAVPLDITKRLEIAILATIITLTPGTITVEIGLDEITGRKVLFVHTLMIDSSEQVIKSIKGSFERQILQITRGTV